MFQDLLDWLSSGDLVKKEELELREGESGREVGEGRGGERIQDAEG